MKILKFSAAWCNPCKMLSKQLLRDTIPLTLEEVDVERNPELSKKYSITAVPTLVLVDDSGNELQKVVGLQPTKLILDKFKAFLVQ